MKGKTMDYSTGYYGIYLEKHPDGWYLYAENGADQFYKNRPTQAEIDLFRDEILEPLGL